MSKNQNNNNNYKNNDKYWEEEDHDFDLYDITSDHGKTSNSEIKIQNKNGNSKIWENKHFKNVFATKIKTQWHGTN